MCMAELASLMHLSEEIGAFIAGVTLASNPIAFYIAESLKPLRDFFLVIFFFAIGAGFNFGYYPLIIWPALALAAFIMIGKPIIFRILLRNFGEPKKTSWEIGVRLGQISEFSLLVVYLSLSAKLIGPQTSYMIQAATMLTFIGSSYWVTLRYPTPLASSEKLRRD